MCGPSEPVAGAHPMLGIFNYLVVWSRNAACNLLP